MTPKPDPSTKNRRLAERRPLDARVTIEFVRSEVSGPGQDISDEGILFLVDGEIEVRVRVAGESFERRGSLVRCHAMGDGRSGMAVRFRD